MRGPHLVAGGVLLAVAVFLHVQGRALGYYTPLGPGPGFFPFWLSGLLVLLSLAVLLRAALGPPEALPDEGALTPRAALRGVAAVGAIAGAALLMEGLGYRLTMLAFLGLLLPVLGYRHPLGVALIALGGSLGVFELFGRVLGTPLPIGVLGV